MHSSAFWHGPLNTEECCAQGPSVGVVVVVRTKWGSRISRERFDIESPNFTGTSVPACSTLAPDMTSRTTSSRKLQQKYRRKCCLRWLQVEFLENGLSDDHQILHGCRRPLVPQTSRIWLGRILVARHFACPTKWWASCYSKEYPVVFILFGSLWPRVCSFGYS